MNTMKAETKVVILFSVFVVTVLVFLFKYRYEPELGGSDPSCDFNQGTLAANGTSTCNMDYSTKIHGTMHGGSSDKTIDAHCTNGYVAGADMVTEYSMCFLNQESHAEQFENCASTKSETHCGWKWDNSCAPNHHVTTKSITCAPLPSG